MAQGTPADLVEAAKNLELAQLEEQKNSVSDLANTWSEALAVEGRQSPADDMQAISRVTVKDVDRVARQYLRSRSCGGGRPYSPGLRPTHILQRFWRQRILQSAARQKRDPTRMGRDSLERLSIPASTVHPVVSILPNGIKLMVQPESISDTISVYGHIKNQPDLQESPGQEGIAQVLNQLFSYGTTTLDRLAFQKALDDIAAQVSTGTSFSLQALSGHFQRGVQAPGG